jgi:hypothetical protein
MYLRNALAVILQVPPTYPQGELTFNLDDYGKKESITPELSGRRSVAIRSNEFL